MLFDLSYLTEQKLDELVPKITEEREEIIDENNKERALKYLLIGIILFAIFCLSVIFLVDQTDGNKAFLCIVFGMLAFTMIPLYLSRKVSKAEELMDTHFAVTSAKIKLLMLRQFCCLTKKV